MNVRANRQIIISHCMPDIKSTVKLVITRHNEGLPKMIRAPTPERPLPHFPVSQVGHIARQHKHIANWLQTSVLYEIQILCKLQMQIRCILNLHTHSSFYLLEILIQKQRETIQYSYLLSIT